MYYDAMYYNYSNASRTLVTIYISVNQVFIFVMVTSRVETRNIFLSAI
jgi:hypothetical protein